MEEGAKKMINLLSFILSSRYLRAIANFDYPPMPFCFSVRII